MSTPELRHFPKDDQPEDNPKVLPWLLRQGYWKALLGLIVLIFAWRIATHFFP
jgi:hypothetical protein